MSLFPYTTLFRSNNPGPSSSAFGDEPENAVDANITITPLTPVNAVGSAEVFTATVTAFPGATGAPSFATPVVPASGGLTRTVIGLTISGNTATFTTAS